MIQRGTWTLALEAEPGPCQAELEVVGARDELRLRLRNATASPLQVARARFSALLDDDARGGTIWIHGNAMQSDALVRVLGVPIEPGYRDEYFRQTATGRCYRSRSVVTLTLAGRAPRALLLGAIALGEIPVDFELDVRGNDERLERLAIELGLEGRTLAPAQTLELPSLLLLTGDDPWQLAEQWAERVARVMGSRQPRRIPSGWCSWTAHYDRVSEQAVLATVQAIGRKAWPLQVVQIDDGYQSAVGDWLVPNARFPSGMKALATAIDAAGLEPGLWLAPLVLHEHSAALRDHPEIALRRPDGQLFTCESWLGRCAVIDCSSRAGARWLSELVTTCVHQWRYRYLKLDGLGLAAVPADGAAYAEPSTTALGHVRRGLELIRQAAGDATYLLGCTCPFGSAVGLVDGMRVGADVKAVWSAGPHASVQHAARTALQRGFLNQRWWVNDADAVLLSQGTGGLSPAEHRFCCTVVALSGGAVMLGDPLAELSAAAQRLGRRLLPPIGRAAQPLDFGLGAVPSLWRTGLDDRCSLLGLLNWGDKPWRVVRAAVVPAGQHAIDLWHGRDVPSAVTLQPHDGALWRLEPEPA